MNNKVRYEYALVDVDDGFEYEAVNTRKIARDKKRDWNSVHPEVPVAIIQRKFKLDSVKKVR